MMSDFQIWAVALFLGLLGSSVGVLLLTAVYQVMK